jgi:hypothetical protein
MNTVAQFIDLKYEINFKNFSGKHRGRDNQSSGQHDVANDRQPNKWPQPIRKRLVDSGSRLRST